MSAGQEEDEEARETWDLRSEENIKECHSPLFKSWRFWTTIIAMFATVQLMMARMSLSMAVVCMVEPPPLPSSPISHGANSTVRLRECGSLHATAEHLFVDGEEVTPLKQHTTRDFHWSKTLQGHLLSSYFYGYIIGILPGGLAVDRWGGRLFMLISVSAITATNFILPAAAYTHYAALYAIRVVQGLAEALGLNAHQFLLARWGSHRDLSLLTSISYVGFPLGVMLSHPLVSTLCLHGPWGGWPSVFYLMGAVGGLWCGAAAFLLHNNPAAHPLVSKEEIRYFLRYGPNINLSGESCGAAAWRRLARSGPVWALVGTSVFGSFGYFAFTLHQPLFFRDVFNFSIEEGSRDEWRQVFRLSGGLYLAGALVFLVWGSAEPLPWITNSSSASVHPPATAGTCLQQLDRKISPQRQKMESSTQTPVNKRDTATATEEVYL